MEPLERVNRLPCFFKMQSNMVVQVGRIVQLSVNKRANSLIISSVMLPDKDSNPDTQNQNLPYYHYTIGQFSFLSIR